MPPPIKPIRIIVARGRNGAIGAGNALPWRLPADLRRFKVLTEGGVVIMGRKTYESIGRALPRRRNIVISRGERDFAGCERANSLQAALNLTAAREPVFIIGGGELYRLALPMATELYITEVDTAPAQADTYFPELNDNDWQQESRVNFAAANNTPAYAFVNYKRIT